MFRGAGENRHTTAKSLLYGRQAKLDSASHDRIPAPFSHPLNGYNIRVAAQPAAVADRFAREIGGILTAVPGARGG